MKHLPTYRTFSASTGKAILLLAYLLMIAVVMLTLVSTAHAEPVQRTTVTIANGEALSTSVDISERTLIGVEIPATWTTANLTLQASSDGGTTWKNVYTASGSEYTLTVTAASTSILIPHEDLVSIRRLRLRSGTAAVPVNQGGARDLVLLYRRVLQ